VVQVVKVLVTFALENEFSPWRRLREFRRVSPGGVEKFTAEIGSTEVAVVITGVGPRQAAVVASKSMEAERESLKFCISSGLAGALQPGHNIAETLVARRVTSERTHADFTRSAIESSAALVSFADELGASVVGKFCTVGRVIYRADEKRGMSAVADAVEMESFEVLREAASRGIPAVAIRSVSDVVDEELPLDLNRVFDDQGRVSFLRVMGQVALHPGSISALMRLGQRSRLAAESLAKFLDRYVVFVAERMANLETQAAVN